MIEISKNSGEVTSELFNNMIDANIDREGGTWVCRKLTLFALRATPKRLWNIWKKNIRYPEVCMKYYNELMADGRWQESLKLLDKAQAIEETQNPIILPKGLTGLK